MLFAYQRIYISWREYDIAFISQVEAKRNKNDNYVSRIKDLTGFCISQYIATICNQLAISKPSVSTSIHNIIGYFREIDLNIFLQQLSYSSKASQSR